MAGELDQTYIFGVSYFTQSREVIDSCVFTVIISFAYPFKKNPKSAAELNHLRKFLLEVSSNSFFLLIENTFPSEYSIL